MSVATRKLANTVLYAPVPYRYAGVYRQVSEKPVCRKLSCWELGLAEARFPRRGLLGSLMERGKGSFLLRGCANRRVTHQRERRTRILDHSGSSLSFPTRRSIFRARPATIHHRARLATVPRLVAPQRNEPSPRLSSPPHPRSGSL